MSFLHFDATTAASAIGIVVNLDGGAAFDVAGWPPGPAIATAGFNFNSGGTVQRYEGGSAVTIDALTDWITPRDTLPDGDWQVRGTLKAKVDVGGISVGNATFPSVIDEVGPWYDLDLTKTFWLQVSTPEYGGDRDIERTVNFEIRNKTFPAFNTLTSVETGGHAIAATGSYFVNVQVFSLA